MMRKHVLTAAASAAGLALMAALTVPGLATADAGATQLAHAGQTRGAEQPCPGMTGQAMMGQGMMGPGMMGQGMMPMMRPTQRDMRGQGMMGQGSMDQGKMGPGMMGQGMMGPGYGARVMPPQDLSGDDVRHFLEHHLAMQGNPRLKVGEVTEKDDNTVVADIVTTEGALVDRFEVDRHTGHMQRVN